LGIGIIKIYPLLDFLIYKGAGRTKNYNETGLLECGSRNEERGLITLETIK